MSDPTRFPQMHIAESVFNRIMNMRDELLPAPIPPLPEQQKGGLDMQQISKGIEQADNAAAGDAIDAGTGVDAAAVDAAGPTSGILGAGAGAGLDSAAAIDAGMAGAGAVGGAAEGVLGAGAAAGTGAAAGAAVAGEAVASGAELLPLLLV